MQAEWHDLAARRAAIDKPYPRRNVHRRARTKRAGSGAPEQHRSSRRDAATPQQDLKPRTQPQTIQNRAAGCGARRATPGTPEACLRAPSTRARSGRATVGRESSGGMDAAGAFAFARDGSLQDAGGMARSRGPEGRYRQALPTPERPQASPHEAGGFWCAGTTRVEPQGCGDAATRPEAAHPTSDHPEPSRRMRRRPRNPRNSRGVFAHPFDKSTLRPRNRRQRKLRRHGCRRSVRVRARREPAGCRRNGTIPRPGGPP